MKIKLLLLISASLAIEANLYGQNFGTLEYYSGNVSVNPDGCITGEYLDELAQAGESIFNSDHKIILGTKKATSDEFECDDPGQWPQTYKNTAVLIKYAKNSAGGTEIFKNIYGFGELQEQLEVRAKTYYEYEDIEYGKVIVIILEVLGEPGHLFHEHGFIMCKIDWDNGNVLQTMLFSGNDHASYTPHDIVPNYCLQYGAYSYIAGYVDYGNHHSPCLIRVEVALGSADWMVIYDAYPCSANQFQMKFDPKHLTLGPNNSSLFMIGSTRINSSSQGGSSCGSTLFTETDYGFVFGIDPATGGIQASTFNGNNSTSGTLDGVSFHSGVMGANSLFVSGNYVHSSTEERNLLIELNSLNLNLISSYGLKNTNAPASERSAFVDMEITIPMLGSETIYALSSNIFTNSSSHSAYDGSIYVIDLNGGGANGDLYQLPYQFNTASGHQSYAARNFDLSSSGSDFDFDMYGTYQRHNSSCTSLPSFLVQPCFTSIHYFQETTASVSFQCGFIEGEYSYNYPDIEDYQLTIQDSAKNLEEFAPDWYTAAYNRSEFCGDHSNVDFLAKKSISSSTAPTESSANDINDISIYPNPTAGKVTVKMEESTGTETYSVRDATGREVLSGKLAMGKDEYDIHLNALEPGIYTVNIFYGLSHRTFKLCLMR